MPPAENERTGKNLQRLKTGGRNPVRDGSGGNSIRLGQRCAVTQGSSGCDRPVLSPVSMAPSDRCVATGSEGGRCRASTRGETGLISRIASNEPPPSDSGDYLILPMGHPLSLLQRTIY